MMLLGRWDVAPTGMPLSQRLSAPQLFVGSFVLLILAGTLVLRLTPGLYTGAGLGWLDSLFTATSAVCVTGLIVEDTATYFTFAGQAVILALIQLGGLGMIAFTSIIIVSLGQRVSLRQTGVAANAVAVVPNLSEEQLLGNVVKFTFLLEAIGAVLLYLLWGPRMGWGEAAWPALFHSVSAFCNAGFSTFTTSLVPFSHDPLTLLVVSALIVIGGLGFVTLADAAYRRSQARAGRQVRLSLHTRMVVATTATLLIGGFFAFTLLEWERTLVSMPWYHRIINGLFMSVTCRTAGFNTIDYAQANANTNFLTILFMGIGGSPGSTAGGIKTTTFFLIGLLAWSRLRGRQIPQVWDRSIPEETTQRAIGLFVAYFGVVTLGIFLLTLTEPSGDESFSFLPHMFEAASAVNTVGLSMGPTAHLSSPGKLVIIGLMFLGRVGPLTFAAALALRVRQRPGRFRYAYEDVVVG